MRPTSQVAKDKMSQQRPIGVLLLIIAFTLIIYSQTISPTINGFDSARFTTAAYTLGIVHAPGYPLYLLLTHLATRLPFGNDALNVNVFSALSASLASGVIFLFVHRLTKDSLSAGITALLFAFARSLWKQALIAEVYTLSALLTSATIYIAWRWHENKHPRTLYLLVFLFGLSLTHHLSAILFLPGLVLYMVSGSDFPRYPLSVLALSLLLFLLPLSLYLYLPLRYLHDPPLNYIRDYFSMDLASIQGTVWMLSGQMFRSAMFGKNLWDGLISMAGLITMMGVDLLGIGFFLGIHGIVKMLRQQPNLALFFLVSIANFEIFFSFYDVVDVNTMLLPALVAFMPFVAVGISSIKQTIPTRFQQYGVTIAGLILISLQLVFNWNTVDHHNDYATYHYAERVIEQVSPQAVIIASWSTATPLEYIQIVEKHRPDVEVVDQSLFILGMREYALRSGYSSKEQIDEVVSAALISHINQKLENHDVYLTETDPFLDYYFCVVAINPDVSRLYHRQSDECQ